MAAKRLAGLKSALETAAQGKAQPEPLRTKAKAKAPDGAKAAGSRSGSGLIHVGAWLPAEYKTSLRIIQTKKDKTGSSFQDLIGEALNDLFAKYDVPVISEG